MHLPAKLLSATVATAMLALSASPVLAQDKAAPAGKVQPGNDPADVRRGAIILSSFNQVLSSKETPQDVRGQLLSCLYNNSLRQVSLAAGKVIAEQKELSDDNPQQIFTAASAVCGVQPAQKGEAAPSR